MDLNIPKGKWEQVKGTIKLRWGELTDNEIANISGNIETLMGLLQEKYGYSKEEVKKQIHEWLNDMGGYMSKLESKIDSLSEEDLGKIARQLGKKTKELYQEKQDQFADVFNECENAMKDRPFVTAGTAFVAGMIFSLLLSRR